MKPYMACGVSMKSSQQARQNFWIASPFRPHRVPRDPLKGSPQPPKTNFFWWSHMWHVGCLWNRLTKPVKILTYDILPIGYYTKNGNPLRAWHFAESWIWHTTFFLSFNVRTGFYIIAILCELLQHWLHREELCPIISDKCPFPSTELTEMVSLFTFY